MLSLSGAVSKVARGVGGLMRVNLELGSFASLRNVEAAKIGLIVMDNPRGIPVIVSIADLAPTQMTLGFREVGFKRRHWRENGARQAAGYLGSHIIPVILGPGSRQYIIDRHHLVRALHEEGLSKVPARLVADMSALEIREFWSLLDSRNCVRPVDENGNRRSFGKIPGSILDLADDPFRSLAGALKRVGGYTKCDSPFSEFRWADFLRGRIARESVECNFDRALAFALRLAWSLEAMDLPGWQGAASFDPCGLVTVCEYADETLDVRVSNLTMFGAELRPN
jgi:hypothetical protein